MFRKCINKKRFVIAMAILLLISFAGGFTKAVADGCDNAFHNCMAREGALLDREIPGMGTFYCTVGYVWCVLYVE